MAIAGQNGRVSYLLRVSLPDRPGSLGALATALGGVGADIVSLDVVEHDGAGWAVDDILVELPVGERADALVTACHSVPGVRVEFLRRYAGGPDLHRDVAAVEEMAQRPTQATAVLTDLAPAVLRADWALLVEPETLVRASATAPDWPAPQTPWLPLFRACTLDPAGWAPDAWRDMALGVVPVGRPARALLVGRKGGPPMLASELARLAHLAALAAALEVGPAEDPDEGPAAVD